MNTNQLECFLTVADTLNFARAAEELHVTQPAVTQQIHTLEDELGTKLFRRTTRSVELTPEGILFMNDAKNILDISEQAIKRFTQPCYSSQEWQILNIGSHTHGEIDLLTDVLSLMREEVPNFHPLFQVVSFQHLFGLLEEEKVDVILSFYETHPKQKNIHYKELSKISMAGFMPATHPCAHVQSLNLDDLKHSTLVLADPRKCPDQLAEINHHLIQDRAISDFFLCDSSESALTLAKAGYGIAILPDLITESDPALQSVPLSETTFLSYGIYYKNLKEKPLLKRFLKLVQEHWHRYT